MRTSPHTLTLCPLASALQKRAAEQEAAHSQQTPTGGTPFSDVHSVTCDEDLGLDSARGSSHAASGEATGGSAAASGETDVAVPRAQRRLDVVEEDENEDAPSSSYSLVSTGRRGDGGDGDQTV